MTNFIIDRQKFLKWLTFVVSIHEKMAPPEAASEPPVISSDPQNIEQQFHSQMPNDQIYLQHSL